MTRLTDVPRPIRRAAAVASVAGAIALAGCATPAAGPAAQTAPPAPSGGAYEDGTYTAEGSYTTPGGVETVEVTVTLAGSTVTAVDVVGDPQARESKEYQGKFIGGIKELVVGKSIDEISVTRVAGSSLTSGGFTKALNEIKTEAQG